MKRAFIFKLLQRVREKPQFIQVVLGPRQVGKTTGSLQLKEEFEGQVIYENADSVFSSKTDWLKEKWLSARVLRKSKESVVLVIDEVHSIPDWSSVIKGLWDEDKKH
jgi:predicted AAA+ superfamily ATPase